MAEIGENDNPVRSALSSRIYAEKANQKFLAICSVGVSGEWARFSKSKVDSSLANSVWDHQIISRPLGAPSHFRSNISFPIIAKEDEMHISPEAQGFCAESADNGEIYWIHKCVIFKDSFLPLVDDSNHLCP